MHKFLIFLLLPILILWAISAAAALPLAMVVEDFEDYGDDDDLASAWPDFDGEPTQTLSTTPHAGDQAMQFGYDVSSIPVAWASHNLQTGADWTGMTRMTIWYQGFATNSTDDLSLQVLDASNSVLFQASLADATDDIGWNVWSLDLTTATGDLSTVDAIVLGVQGTTTGVPGSGVVLFDDISVTDGQETMWLGTDSNWSQSENWDISVPDSEIDARIPAVPSGGQMPVLQSAGAAVHDLTIEAGATLDFNTHNLDVSGTLYNFGTVIQRLPVSANDEVLFLGVGGHPGLRIVTSAGPAVNAPNAPALGDTTVTIRAQQACTTGDNSVRRCFNIEPSISSLLSDGATVTFYFSPEELNGNLCEELAVWHLIESNWEQVVPSDSDLISHQCDVAPYSVTVTGMTQFSPVLLSSAAPVAIGLQTFAAGQQAPATWLGLAAGLLILAGFSAAVLARRRRVAH